MLKEKEDELVEHLKKGIDEKGPCLVCQVELRGYWTDYNGQIKCSGCGTTYQILGSHHTEEFLTRVGLKKEDIAKRYCDVFNILPVLRDFWKETKRTIPLGTYIGSAPWNGDDVDFFTGWLNKNKEKYMREFPTDFHWDKLATGR